MTRLTHITRRSFVAGAGAVALESRVAWAQATGRRIVVIASATRETMVSSEAALLAGLRSRGWVEGENLLVGRIYGSGNNSEIPRLVADALTTRPEVIVAFNSETSVEIKRRDVIIPTVNVGGDVLANSLAATLARPGRITGVTQDGDGFWRKQIELAVEVVPTVQRLGFAYNLTSSPYPRARRAAVEATTALGVELVWVDSPGGGVEVFDLEFEEYAKARVDVVVTPNGTDTTNGRDRIAALSARHRIPVVCGDRQNVVAGVLAGYSSRAEDKAALAADYVDRILRGARPEDLPVQEARTWLAINVTNAKSLGISFPLAVQARADEVIE